MPPSTTFDEPPEFDTGDRVMTVEPIGRRRHRLPKGSSGTVLAGTACRLIAVQFDDGRVEHLHPASLTFEP